MVFMLYIRKMPPVMEKVATAQKIGKLRLILEYYLWINYGRTNKYINWNIFYQTNFARTNNGTNLHNISFSKNDFFFIRCTESNRSAVPRPLFLSVRVCFTYSPKIIIILIKTISTVIWRNFLIRGSRAYTSFISDFFFRKSLFYFFLMFTNLFSHRFSSLWWH